MFVKNWPNLVSKILKLAAKKKIKDKEIKQILKENSEWLTKEANKGWFTQHFNDMKFFYYIYWLLF